MKYAGSSVSIAAGNADKFICEYLDKIGYLRLYDEADDVENALAHSVSTYLTVNDIIHNIIPYCPSLVRSFYRVPSANFLQYPSAGTLDERLRHHQTRDPGNDRVTGVKDYQPQSMIWRWIAEQTDAIAWLELLGYVHGDIRPPSLLLDAREHLKIIDFDNTVAVSSVFDGCQPPYARVLGAEVAESSRTVGYHGHRPERFAIGTVIYYMTRGYEARDKE